MSARWFRLYSDAIRNPKVAALGDKDFRLWVELLSVAADNDGFIPALDALKHVLKRRLDHLSSAVDRLISAKLITSLACGYEPHDWKKHQYKSDRSTERVRVHREKGNVSETPPETETEAETELPPYPLKGGDEKKYAFKGAILKLNHRDFDKWQKGCPSIDLGPALFARDSWLQGQPESVQKQWFHSTPGWLNRQQQEAYRASGGRRNDPDELELAGPC